MYAVIRKARYGENLRGHYIIWAGDQQRTLEGRAGQGHEARPPRCVAWRVVLCAAGLPAGYQTTQIYLAGVK